MYIIWSKLYIQYCGFAFGVQFFCVLAIASISIMFARCIRCTGESSSEVKTEADNDVHSYDDKPRPYACAVCGKRFQRKQHLA